MQKEYIEREWLIDHFDTIRQNMIMRQVDKYPAACAFAIKEIKDFPAADVAEVVQCKDCRHFTEGMAIGMCKRNPDNPIMPMPYNNYCGFGERRKR